VEPSRIVDRARDHVHPGPETHRMMSDVFWTKLVDTGFPDRLRVVDGATSSV
jgi:hypothetical protein